MLIDWFTVGAQALNFLVLVWLLKRFLYHPILDAIDARDARIAAELADAKEKQTDAKAERDRFEQKNLKFDQERSAMLSKATEEVKTERQRLLDEARATADTLRDKRQQTLQREIETLNDQVLRRTQQEVFAIARKTLQDLADISLEERICGVFVGLLQNLTDDARAAFAAIPSKDSGQATIRCTFDLSQELQLRISDAVSKAFSREVAIRFETAPELISGIELSMRGHKIAWSISNYLASIEDKIGEVLTQPTRPQADTVDSVLPASKSTLVGNLP